MAKGKLRESSTLQNCTYVRLSLFIFFFPWFLNVRIKQDVEQSKSDSGRQKRSNHDQMKEEKREREKAALPWLPKEGRERERQTDRKQASLDSKLEGNWSSLLPSSSSFSQLRLFSFSLLSVCIWLGVNYT